MITPTRMNLINTRRRTKMAKKGYDILKRKREVLVIEFLKMVKQSKKDRTYLYSILENAYKAVTIASTYVGTFELEQVAFNAKEIKPVGISVKDIMGVKVPEIYKNAYEEAEPYSFISTSAAVDDIKISFVDSVDTILDVAQREQGLKRLVLEIEKTKRRVNALDNVIIPRFKGQMKYISMRLEEMDRSMFFALKHVKKKIAKRKAVE